MDMERPLQTFHIEQIQTDIPYPRPFGRPERTVHHQMELFCRAKLHLRPQKNTGNIKKSRPLSIDPGLFKAALHLFRCRFHFPLRWRNHHKPALPDIKTAAPRQGPHQIITDFLEKAVNEIRTIKSAALLIPLNHKAEPCQTPQP